MDVNEFYPNYEKERALADVPQEEPQEPHKETPDIPISEEPEPEPEKEYIFVTSWTKIIIAFIFGTIIAAALGFLVASLGITPFLLTEPACNEMNVVAANESFANGAIFGRDAVLFILDREATQCKTIPIKYKENSHNLVAVECLNLTKYYGRK